MNIDKVQVTTVADTTATESPRQAAPDTESQIALAGQASAVSSEPSNIESDIGRKQSVLRDPGELILATDAWHATPASERILSSGPTVPELASTDLEHAVDHAVKFVMDRL